MVHADTCASVASDVGGRGEPAATDAAAAVTRHPPRITHQSSERRGSVQGRPTSHDAHQYLLHRLCELADRYWTAPKSLLHNQHFRSQSHRQSLLFRLLRTPTTWHCPHSHTASAERRPCSSRSISHLTGPTAANLQLRVCCCGLMLG